MADLTSADLAAYVGLKNPSDADNAYIAACWEDAVTLVNNAAGAKAVEGTLISAVPMPVLQRGYLEAGSELFHRRQAPNGIAQFATPDGNPIRVARDPLVGVYPLITPYLGGGFA